jgi:hypothetical protein
LAAVALKMPTEPILYLALLLLLAAVLVAVVGPMALLVVLDLQRTAQGAVQVAVAVLTERQ